jgi:hypothetical protein
MGPPGHLRVTILSELGPKKRKSNNSLLLCRAPKRDRYREILSNPRLRHKFTRQLAHFTDFDPKYRLSIPSNKRPLWPLGNMNQDKVPKVRIGHSERKQPELEVAQKAHTPSNLDSDYHT